MANQSSLGAVTQIRKGVTTPREPAIAPWSNPFVPRSFSISLLFFLSIFSFFFLSFLFSIANGDRSLNVDCLSHSLSLCARLCARPVETGPLSLRSRVPTSTGERSTCNLLCSILRRAFYLRYVCLSVYPGPYANYTKGLQRPPSASLKNTHVRAREPRVSRVGSADASVRYLTAG